MKWNKLHEIKMPNANPTQMLPNATILGLALDVRAPLGWVSKAF